MRLRPATVGDGTVVTLRLDVDPPGPDNALISAAAATFAIKALYRTKALVETGEVPTLEHNPSTRQGDGDRI